MYSINSTLFMYNSTLYMALYALSVPYTIHLAPSLRLTLPFTWYYMYNSTLSLVPYVLLILL